MTHAVSNSESVQNYVAGRLSPAERDAFEKQLTTDAGLVRDLEESLRLREGLEILQERNELVRLRRPGRRRFLVAGAAAAVLAIIAVGVGLNSMRRTPAVIAASVAALRVNATAPLAVVERYSFATPRAANQSPGLVLPASGALELRALTPGADVRRTFRVALEEVRNQGETSRIGVVEHLAPDVDGLVMIYADASRLEPGKYSLSVTPEGPDKTAGEQFAFRLERADATHAN